MSTLYTVIVLSAGYGLVLQYMVAIEKASEVRTKMGFLTIIVPFGPILFGLFYWMPKWFITIWRELE